MLIEQSTGPKSPGRVLACVAAAGHMLGTRIMFPSGIGIGLILPLAGGSSAKSIYSPAKMRSTTFLGNGGRPRANWAGVGWLGPASEQSSWVIDWGVV